MKLASKIKYNLFYNDVWFNVVIQIIICRYIYNWFNSSNEQREIKSVRGKDRFCHNRLKFE
jgi:hypothetical protein